MLTLGVAGVGDINQAVAWELLDDFIKGHGGQAQFIFEVTPEAWTQALEECTDFAFRGDYDYKVVTTAEGKSDEQLRDVMHGSVPPIRTSGNPDERFLSLLEAEDNPFFIALFDPNDEPTVAQITAAKERGLTVLDLCDGLQRLVFEGEEDGDAEEPEGEPMAYTPGLDEPEDEVEEEDEVVEEGVVADEDEEEDEDEPVSEPLQRTAERRQEMVQETKGEERETPMTATDIQPLVLGLADKFDALAEYCRQWGAAAGNGGAAVAPQLPEPSQPTKPRRRGRAAATTTPTTGTKRRGRPPLPRDEHGNIIRSNGTAKAQRAGKTTAKKGRKAHA